MELPLTFKLRTKEIGYTTYFGKFGGGVGLNTRRKPWNLVHGSTISTGTSGLPFPVAIQKNRN